MKANFLSALVANAALTAALLLATPTTHAQTFTSLKSFASTAAGLPDGYFAHGGLALSDGMLFGVTSGGGISNNGTLYKLGTNGGGFTVIHHFAGGSEGESPNGRVVVSGDTIYGVTYHGGINHGGTLYRVNTDGSSFSILRRLGTAASDGTLPSSGMVLSGSTLYGTTATGGTSDRGVVYKINTNGSGYQNLHLFDGSTEGFQPEAELTLIGNTLFGTTAFGRFDIPNGGMLFKLGLDGTGFTVLYTFTNSFELWSCSRISRLTPVGDALYGVGTSYDGFAQFSSIYKINTNGSGFHIVGQMPSGVSICGALTWTGSELLGAAWGNSGSFDQVFKINTNGTGYQVLRTFGVSGSSDPSLPLGDHVLDGTAIYGVAIYGGEFNNGTVYRFDLRPRLAIAAAGADVKLSWPSYAQAYQLEQSPALAPASWTNVTAAPADDGTNQSLTFNPGPGNRFYRLFKP